MIRDNHFVIKIFFRCINVLQFRSKLGLGKLFHAVITTPNQMMAAICRQVEIERHRKCFNQFCDALTPRSFFFLHPNCCLTSQIPRCIDYLAPGSSSFPISTVRLIRSKCRQQTQRHCAQREWKRRQDNVKIPIQNKKSRFLATYGNELLTLYDYRM